MAPEMVTNPAQVNEKADVWSLGMVMLEMVTRNMPFADLEDSEVLAELRYRPWRHPEVSAGHA